MTEANLVADREQFLFKSFEQLKLNDYLNENDDDSCLNAMKFTCSTPIKFNPKLEDDEYDNDNSENTNKKPEKVFNDNQSVILNQSIEIKKSASHDYLFEKCNFSLHETTFKQESLIEFERNEKLVAQETTASNLVSSINVNVSPVLQLENLLSNLRAKSTNLIDDVCSKSLNKSTADSVKSQTQLTPNSQVSQVCQASGYLKKSEQMIALEKRLEHEIFRRQHCEKQIHELNENLLELQQELAVSKGLDRKKEIFIQNMEATIQKVIAFLLF